jgi:hypothetical protein
VAQVVEHLPSSARPWVQPPSTTKTKQNKREKYFLSFFFFFFRSTGTWTQGLAHSNTWLTSQALFTLVIFQLGSCSVVPGWLQILLSMFLCSWDSWGALLCLACWLRWILPISTS